MGNHQVQISSGLKHKNFFSLILDDMLNARAILKMKVFFIKNGYSSPLCSQAPEETTHHLLWGCDFAWEYL